MKHQPSNSQAESRRILDRVSREAEASPVPVAAEDADDWAEVWGTRIGRVLGPLLLVGLAVWLVLFVIRG